MIMDKCNRVGMWPCVETQCIASLQPRNRKRNNNEWNNRAIVNAITLDRTNEKPKPHNVQYIETMRCVV